MVLKFITVVSVVGSIFSNAIPVFEDLYKFEIDSFLSDDDAYSEDAEQGEHFEGDMLLTPQQLRSIYNTQTQRNGLKDTTKRWPNRTVVFHIVEDDFDEHEINMIDEAMMDIASKSCIKFRPRENNEHAVIIQGKAKGCFSNVGFTHGKHQNEEGEVEEEHVEDKQVLNLSKGCFKHGSIVHEILHTLGFYHMQSSYDRDEYVKIIWENILTGREHNFQKYTEDSVTDFDVPYDYDSVMHYPERAFSKNKNRTIIPLKENVKIGQRNGLSESDIVKLNRMYCDS